MSTIIYSSPNTSMISRVVLLLNRVSLSCLGKDFFIIVDTDKKGGQRVYIQIEYTTKCIKTGEEERWKGRKHYLSEHMSNDEIIKTAYLAFKLAVEHEIMEGFKVDEKVLFNPHIDFEELLKISHKEIKRL